MFYKMMLKRSAARYKRSWGGIFLLFTVSMMITALLNVYCDSLNNHFSYSLEQWKLENDCDFRIKNITEEQAREYMEIPGIICAYVDGELDIDMVDESDFEKIREQINAIYEPSINWDDYYGSPQLYRYYNNELRNNEENVARQRIMTAIFQVIVSTAAIMAMTLVYRDYIAQRAGDIRTLNSIGIGEKKIHGLFFRECNLLFFPAAVIGIPIGVFIVWLFSFICERADMRDTVRVFPVFKVELASLLYIILIGYAALLVTYRLTFAKILRLDTYGQYADNALAFNHWKSREYYFKADRHFDTFMMKAINKRRPKSYILAGSIASLTIAFGIFMAVAGFSMFVDEFDHGITQAFILASIATSGQFFLTAAICFLFSMVILWVFTKRNLASIAPFVRTAYAIGADVDLAYSSFGRSAYLGMIYFELIGLVIGVIGTVAICSAVWDFAVRVSLAMVVTCVLLAVGYYFLNIACVKRYFFINCKEED